MKTFRRVVLIAGAGALLAGMAAVAACVVPAASAAPASAVLLASTPRCSISGLVVWLDTKGSGTAGGTYYYLEFTNESGHVCTLEGYPRVSAVNLAGRQIGSPSSTNSAFTPSVVVLSNASTSAPIGPGSIATVVLKISDVGVYGPTVCDYMNAAGLRVSLPGQTASKVVPYPFTGCLRTAPSYLMVEAVQKGILPG